MPGYGGTVESAVTPYRGSLLRLDVPVYVLVEPPGGITRHPSEMSRDPESQSASHNVHILDADGWELLPYQMNIGFIHERKETSGAIVGFTTPSGFSTLTVYRKPSDQSGTLSGASSNILDTGDLFYKKHVGSGESWDDASLFQLATDQASMPSPDTSDDTLVMDRVALSLTNHDPNDGFFSRFRISGGKVTAADKALGNFFSGPPGVTPEFQGYGYYNLTFCGDGNMFLYERGKRSSDSAEVWRIRATIRFCPSQVATTGTHRIYVRPVTYKVAKGISGHIYFYHEGSDRVSAGGAKTTYSGANSMALVAVYSAPFTGTVTPSATPRPWRWDHRRGERHEFQNSRVVYPNSGVLRCDKFGIDSYMISTMPMKVCWWGIIPYGCGIDLKAYNAILDADGTYHELTLAGTSGLIYDADGNVIGGYKYYTIVYPQRQFFVEATLTGPADLTNGVHVTPGTGLQSSKTPILTRYQIIKDGRTDDINPGETTTKTTMFSMTSQDADPSHETGSTCVKDATSAFALLGQRASIPCIYQTKYDSADPTKVSHLMRGWVQKADAERKGSKVPQGMGSSTLQPWPHEDWKSYDLTIMGEWMRLAVARMPFRWDFAIPSDLGENPKVTEVMRQGFSFAGYVADQLDLPTNDLRMFWGSEPQQYLNPMADIGEFLNLLAMDYLGSWLTFDANAKRTDSSVDRGLWRLRPQNTINGPVLAHFHIEAASDAYKLARLALPHSQLSYPSQATGLQITQHSYVRKGTLHSYVRAPEANIITITATQNKVFGTGRDAENAWTVTLPNPRSFNFSGLHPGDPGYPDPTDADYLPFISPYEYPDLNIRSLEGAQWIARRVFDRLCHGSKCVTFEGPLLLVTDSTDTYQIRPRPLRFYDLIMIDGIKFYVKSVTIKYKKDKIQMATYECELPNGVLY